MLQVIVMALLIGFAIILVGEEKNTRIITACNDLNDVFMKCMEMILKLSPIGVFCLLCPVVAANGATIIGSLAMVLLAAYVCYIVHAVVVYSFAVKTIGGISPLTFFKEMLPAIMFAFSSASSVGHFLLTWNVQRNLELPEKSPLLSFHLVQQSTWTELPFIRVYVRFYCFLLRNPPYTAADAYNHLYCYFSFNRYCRRSWSGNGYACKVLTSVGLPVDGIALVAGVDRIFDMGRTTVNITGDASCCVIVSNLEKKREARKMAKSM